MSRTRIVFLVLLALSSAAAPARASHDDATPPLDRGESPSPHWVSYAFSTDGAKVVADFEVQQVRKPAQVGYALYDDQNRSIFRYMFVDVDGTTGVYVDGTPAGENIHVDLTQPSSESSPIGVALTINGKNVEPVAGTFKLLMWSAGGGKRHIHSLRGATGSSCLGVASGKDTFLYTGRDFSGTATVVAGVGGSVGARANMETTRTVHAKGTLVGAYLPMISAADEMSVDAPWGSADCPCFFGSFLPNAPSTPFGPGTYTFHDTGAGAAGGEGEVVLAGADAELVGLDATGVKPCSG
ncbi:MAG: hypothetical protein ACRDHM_04705 [Actinomycetota bacterium]